MGPLHLRRQLRGNATRGLVPCCAAPDRPLPALVAVPNDDFCWFGRVRARSVFSGLVLGGLAARTLSLSKLSGCNLPSVMGDPPSPPLHSHSNCRRHHRDHVQHAATDTRASGSWTDGYGGVGVRTPPPWEPPPRALAPRRSHQGHSSP